MTKKEIDETRSEIIRLTKRQIGIYQDQRAKLRQKIADLEEALKINAEEIHRLEAELNQIDAAQ